jgi:hypothetical protein
MLFRNDGHFDDYVFRLNRLRLRINGDHRDHRDHRLRFRIRINGDHRDHRDHRDHGLRLRIKGDHRDHRLRLRINGDHGDHRDHRLYGVYGDHRDHRLRLGIRVYRDHRDHRLYGVYGDNRDHRLRLRLHGDYGRDEYSIIFLSMRNFGNFFILFVADIVRVDCGLDGFGRRGGEVIAHIIGIDGLCRDLLS